MFVILGSRASGDAKRVSIKRKWYRSPKLIRHGVMLFFFLFLVKVAYHHIVLGGGPNGTPSVEAYCPFGGIETLYQFVTTGGFIRRIEPSTLILLVAVVVLTLVASRGFCGWICPFGSIQEWIGLLGRKIFRKRYNPTGWWDRRLRPMKYVVLAAVISLTWWTGSLVFREYDPFLAFFHLGQHMDELVWAYSILGVVLAGSLFIERFFCKYACPLGAVIGVFGKAGIMHIERAEDGCKECNLCQKKCHAHVEFLPHKEIRSAECNHCLDCVVDCPKPNVLSVRGMKLRFSHYTYAVVLLTGFLGLIGISQMSGKWQTKPDGVVVRNAAGELDASTIRGWMTLRDVSNQFRIPLTHLYSGAGIEMRVPPETRVNKVGPDFQEGFSPESVRDFVEDFLQAHPHSALHAAEVAQDPSGDPVHLAQLRASRAEPMATAVPEPATPAEESPGSHRQQPEPRANIRKGEEPGRGNPDRPGAGEPGENREHSAGEEPEVKGFMTLHEIVLKTGVPKSFLLERLGINDDIPGTEPIRSWMHAKGLTIQDVRQAVEDYRVVQKK